MTRAHSGLRKSAEHLLADLARVGSRDKSRRIEPVRRRAEDIAALVAADLLTQDADGSVQITAAGLAHLARGAHTRANSPVDPFRAQHLALVQHTLHHTEGAVTLDQAESPLAWLARRTGRDGCSLIKPQQLQAGERLRAEFTRAQLMPRTTSNWSATAADDRRAGGAGTNFTEAVIAARQRLRHALDAVGPEFSGLLLDVCCFLKSLADVERERGWPPRTAKVVLKLGLDRLARHYGFAAETRGRNRAPVRTWLAPDAKFVVEE